MERQGSVKGNRYALCFKPWALHIPFLTIETYDLLMPLQIVDIETTIALPYAINYVFQCRHSGALVDSE